MNAAERLAHPESSPPTRRSPQGQLLPAEPKRYLLDSSPSSQFQNRLTASILSRGERGQASCTVSLWVTLSTTWSMEDCGGQAPGALPGSPNLQLKSRRWILPVSVRGITSTTQMRRGILSCDRRLAAQRRSAPARPTCLPLGARSPPRSPRPPGIRDGERRGVRDAGWVHKKLHRSRPGRFFCPRG